MLYLCENRQAANKKGKKQIRAIVLYELKLGRETAETARSINRAFGEGTVNERTAQHWFRRFRNGDESFQNEEGRRRPRAIDDNQPRAIVEAEPRNTTREGAEELDKTDKWVPHELNGYQKIRRYEICSALLLRKKINPFLDRIETCDENGFYTTTDGVPPSGWTKMKL
uniref:HTH_48 domain-containing protein n=1 Tax=Heterorhabditis bacteriophora TaxID=37862 RepID=A0A1I7X3G7_HETBA